MYHTIKQDAKYIKLSEIILETIHLLADETIETSRHGEITKLALEKILKEHIGSNIDLGVFDKHDLRRLAQVYLSRTTTYPKHTDETFDVKQN